MRRHDETNCPAKPSNEHIRRVRFTERDNECVDITLSLVDPKARLSLELEAVEPLIRRAVLSFINPLPHGDVNRHTIFKRKN